MRPRRSRSSRCTVCACSDSPCGRYRSPKPAHRRPRSRRPVRQAGIATASNWRNTTGVGRCPPPAPRASRRGKRLASDPRPAPPPPCCATTASSRPASAPFGVADQRVAAAELGHHARGNLAGMGSAGVLADVLRTPGDRRPGQRGLRLPKVRMGNANRQLADPRAPPTRRATPPAGRRFAAGRRSFSSCRRPACRASRTRANRDPRLKSAGPTQTQRFYPAASERVNALQRNNGRPSRSRRGIVEIARRPAARGDRLERRGSHLAARHRVRAAGVELAA